MGKGAQPGAGDAEADKKPILPTSAGAKEQGVPVTFEGLNCEAAVAYPTSLFLHRGVDFRVLYSFAG